MCGIVGICSDQNVSGEAIRRLASLEYRGYDSYGLAVMVNGTIAVQKDIGSIRDAILDESLLFFPPATVVIGHTRWATHGVVSQANCHPHISYNGSVGIVHNGIISNYVSLRSRLQEGGITPSSQTDSEVIAHMVASKIDEGMSVIDAISAMMSEVTGEYALGIIATTDPNVIYGVRCGSPLVLYNSSHQAILASDQLAFEGCSGGRVTLLEDGDMARIAPQSVEVFAIGPDERPHQVDRKKFEYVDSTHHATKGEFPHFMIKEIHETPGVVARILQLANEEFTATLPPRGDRPILLFGSGSGYYVAQIGQYLLAQLAGVSSVAMQSDEAEAFTILKPGDYTIAISQSGETFDTLEMCRVAMRKGATVTAITNVPNSTLDRIASHSLLERCGPEVSVLSTKSLVSQVMLLARLALELGKQLDSLSHLKYEDYLSSMLMIPEALQTCMTVTAQSLQEHTKKYANIRHWFFMGRGVLYPVAMESALKFKEGTYRQAEGLAAGSFKHGPISLIEEGFHTIALLPSDTGSSRYSATLATVSEIAARGGKVTGWGPSVTYEEEGSKFANYVDLPYLGSDIVDVVVQLVIGQLWAYYYALNLGRNIDKPRYLAKSVTVR